MKTLTVKLADYLEVDGWDIAENLTDDLGSNPRRSLSLKASKEEIEEFVEVIATFRRLHGNV